jgi:hypothetical protein
MNDASSCLDHELTQVSTANTIATLVKTVSRFEMNTQATSTMLYNLGTGSDNNFNSQSADE